MTASASERLASRTILFFALVLVITPLVYLVGLSFKAPEGIFSNPIVPFSWPLDGRTIAVRSSRWTPKFFLNSLIMRAATLGQLIHIPAAFAFSYYDFRQEPADVDRADQPDRPIRRRTCRTICCLRGGLLNCWQG